MLGEKASPLKSTKGFRWAKLLMAVANRAAPPTGSVSAMDSML